MSLVYADGHEGLVDALDAHVRDRVRRDGVDPQADVALVRRIAEEAVRAHDERSLTGQVAPVPDVGALVGELVARISGFGPLQPYLDDDTVEEVSTKPHTVRRPLATTVTVWPHLLKIP